MRTAAGLGTITILVAALLASTSCSSGSGGTSSGDGDDGGATDDAAPPNGLASGTLGDGFYRITVAQPDATRDDVWLYALSPVGDGPLPVVVYARGRGIGDVANCAPRAGGDGKVLGADTRARVKWLADLGYLAVAIAYRNVGDGAPGAGTLRMRDDDVRDTRAVLAAAQWARREHRRGSPQVAYIGASMGTWPSFWAVSTRADVADLQQGLDPKTTILVAETTNHLRNSVRTAEMLVAPTAVERALGVYGAAVSGVAIGAIGAKAASVPEGDLTSGVMGDLMQKALTPKGIELAQDTMLHPATVGLKGCTNLADVPPICETDCAGSTFAAMLPVGATDVGPVGDWIKPALVEALGYWKASATDPGPEPSNPFIKTMRNGSPIFAANGLLVRRALSLLSVNDPHYDAAVQQTLITKLASLGATIPNPAPAIATDAKGACGHEEYLDATRECGFALVREELRTAFAR